MAFLTGLVFVIRLSHWGWFTLMKAVVVFQLSLTFNILSGIVIELCKCFFSNWYHLLLVLLRGFGCIIGDTDVSFLQLQSQEINKLMNG